MDFQRNRARSRSRKRSRSRSRNRWAKSLGAKPDNVEVPAENPTAASRSLQDVDMVQHFLVQLAHGSMMHSISGVSTIAQLYDKIAECFPNVPKEDFLYLTNGTYKVDMDAVVSSQLNFGDILFLHVRGEKRELEIQKTDKIIGLTISDNGIGKCFVKKIRPGSAADLARPAVAEGMHIERINDVDMVGKRHYDVALFLRELPIGSTVKLRLICPFENGLTKINPRQEGISSPKIGDNGAMTIRFKANGSAVVQQVAEPNKEKEGEVPAEIVAAINKLFEEYIGCSDEELSRSVCEVAAMSNTPVEMVTKLRETELASFSFPDELVFDLYGLYSDIKSGRGIPVKQ